MTEKRYNAFVTTRAKTIAATSAITGLIALGAIDALMTVDNSPLLAAIAPQDTMQPSDPGTTTSSVSSSATSRSVPSGPEDATAKATGPNVRDVISNVGLVANSTNDPMFLPRVIRDEGAQINKAVLLDKGERAGLIAWTDSSKVKIYFVAVKEALHQSFTPEVKDLVDETQQRPGRPPRNFLTFVDTGISEERIAFARVRERLYELHVTQGKEEIMFELLDQLTM